MEFLVLTKPGPAPPPVELVRSAQAWLDAKLSDGTIKCSYAFVGGGGFSVSQADSHEKMMDELLDYPLTPFVEYEVRPLVGLNHAFDRYIALVEHMTAQMAGQAG
jgi:hypothetical protein